MAGGALRALGAAVLVAAVTTGCRDVPGPHSGAGKYPQYAKYQDAKTARAQLRALLATIPVYAGAREVSRTFSASTYYVGKDYETIDAEPYSLGVYWRVPDGPSGTAIMRFLRRELPARGWQCGFTPRARGVRRAYECRRGHQRIGGSVNDSGGYGMGISVSDAVPPIEQVPQVE